MLFVGFDLQPAPSARDDSGGGRRGGRHPDVRLEIVGDNRTFPRQDLEAIARRRASPVARRSGRTSPTRPLADLYARAGVFVFLSDYEGFGLTPLEALSLRRARSSSATRRSRARCTATRRATSRTSDVEAAAGGARGDCCSTRAAQAGAAVAGAGRAGALLLGARRAGDARRPARGRGRARHDRPRHRHRELQRARRPRAVPRARWPRRRRPSRTRWSSWTTRRPTAACRWCASAGPPCWPSTPARTSASRRRTTSASGPRPATCVLLLNSDTVVPPGAIDGLVRRPARASRGGRRRPAPGGRRRAGRRCRSAG